MTAGVTLARLRAATREAHARMEARLAFDRLRDIDAYRALLARFHGFWRVWEPAIAAHQHEAWFGPRRRLALLADDLAALGFSGAEIAALPVCTLPGLRDAAAAMGSLYVMEGSTLGGRVILRQVEPWVGAEGRGCRYFAGYGARTGEMWRGFVERLDALPAAQTPAVIEGAIATFACLEGWLGAPLFAAGDDQDAEPADRDE